MSKRAHQHLIETSADHYAGIYELVSANGAISLEYRNYSIPGFTRHAPDCYQVISELIPGGHGIVFPEHWLGQVRNATI